MSENKYICPRCNGTGEAIEAGTLIPWPEIDTAPRDGRDILTWDGTDQRVLFFSQHGNGWTDGDPKIKYNPTHWMELTPPPQH